MGVCLGKKKESITQEQRREMIKIQTYDIIRIWSDNCIIIYIMDIIFNYTYLFEFKINDWNILNNNKNKIDYHGWGDYIVITNKHDNSKAIMKTYDKKKRAISVLHVTVKTAFNNEYNILKQLSHDNILNILTKYEDKDYYYIIHEYHSGENLYDIVTNPSHVIKEELCKLFVKDMLLAYQYLDKLQMYHSNLKPESYTFKYKFNYNCIRDVSKYKNIIMLKNFNNCMFVDNYENEYLTRDNTAAYLAPELAKGWIKYKTDSLKYKGIYYKTNDMYSIGIITYAILYRYSPYIDVHLNNYKNICQKCINGEWRFRNVDPWGNSIELTNECKDFISKLLENDYNKRMNVNDALNHEWIIG